MKLSDKQLDELVNAWFDAAARGRSLDDAEDDEEFWRYRMTKVLEALEKMTNQAPVQAQGEAFDLLRAVEKDLHERGLTSLPIFGQVVSFLYRGTSTNRSS